MSFDGLAVRVYALRNMASSLESEIFARRPSRPIIREKMRDLQAALMDLHVYLGEVEE